MCLSVLFGSTFKSLDPETSLIHFWCGGTSSEYLGWSAKVTGQGQGQGHRRKNVKQAYLSRHLWIFYPNPSPVWAPDL